MAQTRYNLTANISSHDLVTYFWPPFVSAIQRGGVNGIMYACALCMRGSVCNCDRGYALMCFHVSVTMGL